MLIGIPKEILPAESRVAAIPDAVRKYIALGFDVGVETNAGRGILISDDDYQDAGAMIYFDAESLYADADIILTDVALVVEACDVVNPAAQKKEGTPISGMPILLAHKARHVVVCNYDAKPGYSGVPNPLYGHSDTIALFGDAKVTANELMRSLKNLGVGW